MSELVPSDAALKRQTKPIVSIRLATSAIFLAALSGMTDATLPKDEQVKRYNCTSGGAQFCQGCYQMEADEDGDYVRFEDYERIKAERDLYKQMAEISANTIKCMQAAVNLHAAEVKQS